MKVYYSHPKTYKDSKEEADDIRLLKSLGHEVENPYDPKFAEHWYANGIEFGRTLVEMCDAVAFRPLSNGKIGAGVGKELRFAAELGKPILEMPRAIPFDDNSFNERVMTIDETVEFFNTVGK